MSLQIIFPHHITKYLCISHPSLPIIFPSTNQQMLLYGFQQGCLRIQLRYRYCTNLTIPQHFGFSGKSVTEHAISIFTLSILTTSSYHSVSNLPFLPMLPERRVNKQLNKWYSMEVHVYVWFARWLGQFTTSDWVWPPWWSNILDYSHTFPPS